MGFKRGSKILNKFDSEESAIKYKESQNHFYLFNGFPHIASIVRRQKPVYTTVDWDKAPEYEYLVIDTPKKELRQQAGEP
jgi:hypothetical protein